MELMRALKIRFGGSGNPDLDLLADTHKRNILLEHLGLQPHRRQVGDRIQGLGRNRP